MAEAVLGPTEDEMPPDVAADAASRRLMAIAAGAVLALAAVGLIGWKLAGADAPLPAPVVEAPPPVADVAAAVVHLDAPEAQEEEAPARLSPNSPSPKRSLRLRSSTSRVVSKKRSPRWTPWSPTRPRA